MKKEDVVMENKLKAEAAILSEKVKSVRTANSLVFTMYSDLHTDSPSDKPALVLYEALSAITESVNPDAVLNLGDNLSMLGRNYHISNEELKQRLVGLFERTSSAADRPLLLINGNHDGIGTDFFKPELWNEVTKGRYDRGLANYHSTGSYYYVDFPKASTRLVFLSLPSDSDIDVEYPTPHWRYGEEQLRWLKDIALDTDFKVLLFAHVPLYYETDRDPEQMLGIWDGERATDTYIRALCGWIEDRAEAAEIINSFGKTFACLSGHIHTESLWAPFEERNGRKNPLSCYQYVTTQPVSTEGEPAVAIDVLVFCPEEEKLHILRFGEGNDTVLSYDAE